MIARASRWRQKITLSLAQEVLPNIGDRVAGRGRRRRAGLHPHGA